MDQEKVDLLLSYILAVAGQGDRFENEVGPIHIIKYAYLADLAYAEHHDGETFTGIPWVFHSYGPWSFDLYQRIPKVVSYLGATERVFQSQFQDDVKRWTVRDEGLLEEIGAKLPLDVSLAVRGQFRRFSNRTSELLHHVYATHPMLRAAPGEPLDFTPPPAIQEGPPSIEPDDTSSQFGSPTSAKARKRRRQELKELRDKIKARRRLKSAQETVAQPKYIPPRYDNVYHEGVEWLDSLAGEPIVAGAGVVEVDPSVWKSKARSDDGVAG